MKKLRSLVAGLVLTIVALSAIPVLPGSASAGTGWPIERRGKHTLNVWAVQYLLRSHGYRLEADGIFGPQTEDRVKRFQRRHNLEVDGVIGPQTWPLLVRRLERGARGPAVKALQSRLCANGYTLELDGIFGIRTYRAVRRFQSDVGVEVDGIVGRRDWRRLVQPIADPEYSPTC